MFFPTPKSTQPIIDEIENLCDMSGCVGNGLYLPNAINLLEKEVLAPDLSNYELQNEYEDKLNFKYIKSKVIRL